MKRKTIPENQRKRFAILSSYLREFGFAESLSQNELAQVTGLHRNTIINAEAGRNLTLLNIFELADALDITSSELFSLFE